MEPSSIYSKNAIAVKEKNSTKIVVHIPEPLAKILYPLMKSWKVYEITCTITGHSKKAPEGTIRGHKGQNFTETRCRGFLVLESRCRGFSVMESRCRGFSSSEKMPWNHQVVT